MVRTSLLIALLVGLIFFFAVHNRLLFANDEGIYVDGAVRVLHGQVPYRDFFAITGPATFWLLAALFRLFGVSLDTVRLLRALDLAVMTGLTCWITARWGHRLTAVFAALLFAVLATDLPNGLVVNHRWEASAFALAAVAAGVLLIEKPAPHTAFAAGALSILGAWCTPSVGLVTIVIGFWIFWQQRLRSTTTAFLSGALLAGLIPAGVLVAQRALVPLLQSMGWNSARYSLANRIAYGSMLQNPFHLLGQAHGLELVPAVLFLVATLLPAILPPLVTLVWLPALRTPARPEVFLLVCGAAMIGSSLPRWDLMHLLYVAPVFVVLAALWVERHGRGLMTVVAVVLILVPVAVMSGSNLIDRAYSETLETPAGKLKASPEVSSAMRKWFGLMHPGDTLFVYPYQPLIYFVTGGKNVTRYSFLQPGMMSAGDETTVADQLKADPPKWVVFGNFTVQDYLHIWPSSNPADLKMPAVEGFVHDQYEPTMPDDGSKYQLLQRRNAPR